MKKNTYKFEIGLENRLRKTKWLISLITFITSSIMIYGILICMHYFNLGNYWTIIPAAFLAHAFFIVLLHDASHKSITKTKADRIIMNIGSGILLLPFYGELFRRYHLIHHGNTNSIEDPLWPTVKTHLYENRRWFYILCEFVPILFSIYLIFMSKKEREVKIKGPKVEIKYILGASVISLAIILLVPLNGWFLLFTLLLLNIISTIRHWCEHMGYDNSVESNTFWFPLGMGIGNHSTHHNLPHISWFVLMIGLFYRKKNASFFKSLFGVIFRNKFMHYKK